MYTVTDSAPAGLSLADFPAPAGRVIAGAFDDALETNPIPLFMLSRELNAAKGIGPRLTREQAAEETKRHGVSVAVPDDGISTAALGILIERKKDQAARDLLFTRREGTAASVGMFGAGLAGAIFDPLNAASGFIPVLSGTRYAATLARAGTSMGRAGVRLGVGAAEGAVGAAAVEMPTIALRRDLQDDYGLYDSLTNIAFGTFASAGLRGVTGLARDRWRGLAAARQEDFLRSVEPAEWAAARMTYERQLERDMFSDLEFGFERGQGPSEGLIARWSDERIAAERLRQTDDDIIRMQARMSDAEIERFVEAERQFRSEAAAPGADDRQLLDASGIAERKFREMDLKEVRDRLKRGDGLIVVPGNAREVAAAISDETHAQAVKTAVAQAVEGRRIDVEGIVRTDRVFGPQRLSASEVKSRAKSNMTPEAKVASDPVASRKAAQAIETEAPAAEPGRAEPPPPRGSPGEAAGAEAMERVRTALQKEKDRKHSAEIQKVQDNLDGRDARIDKYSREGADERVAKEIELKRKEEKEISRLKAEGPPKVSDEEVRRALPAPVQKETPKSAELVAAEEKLALAKVQLEQAANDAGIELPKPKEGEKDATARAQDYERAWQAIAACARGKGL